jgi:hypothetical protein
MVGVVDDTRVVQTYFPLQVNVAQWDHAEIYRVWISSFFSLFKVHEGNLPEGTAGIVGGEGWMLVILVKVPPATVKCWDLEKMAPQ